MDRPHIEQRVTELVAEAHPEYQVGTPVTATFDELGIDSLTTMDLLARIETVFGVEISDDRLAVINSIKDLVDHLAEEESCTLPRSPGRASV